MRKRPGLEIGPRFQSNREPLYRRLPGSDAGGRLPADFMMLIPGLRQLAPNRVATRLALLQSILGRREDVLFVDLNLPLNLLWVSVSQRNGIINELSAEIRAAIPEARLVGHPAPPSAPRRPRPGAPAMLAAPRRLLAFWRRR